MQCSLFRRTVHAHTTHKSQSRVTRHHESLQSVRPNGQRRGGHDANRQIAQQWQSQQQQQQQLHQSDTVGHDVSASDTAAAAAARQGDVRSGGPVGKRNRCSGGRIRRGAPGASAFRRGIGGGGRSGRNGR